MISVLRAVPALTWIGEEYSIDLRMPEESLIGPGRFAQLPEVASKLGKAALLVTGASSLDKSGLLAETDASLGQRGISCLHLQVAGEPDVKAVDEAARVAREARCDLVIAVGGGSVLDLGKAAAGMIPNAGSIQDYLEGVGRGAVMARDPLPFIAVPTTAGTGSEVSRNAVITGPGFKKSFRDIRLIPRVAIVDAELTLACPPPLTAACGMDAVTQLVEAYTSLRASMMTDALARDGLSAAGRALPAAVGKGGDLLARCRMSYASFLSGIALSHAGLGAVHGLASPLGAAFPVPHGVACAKLLPLVTRANRAALAGGRGKPAILEIYRRIESALGKSIADFCAQFTFPGLASFGVTSQDIPRIVEAATGGSMKTNPVELSALELGEILAQAL